MKQPLWTKDFLLFISTNFFIALNFYLLITTMSLFAIEQFAASSSAAGLASSIFVLGALLARLVAGSCVEKIGRRKMLYSGLVLFLVASLLYFFSSSLVLLFVIRFIHGIAFGIANTAINTTIMDSLPAERRGEGTGYFSLSGTAATAIGPFLGIWLMNHYSMNAIFVFTSVVAVVALVFALLAKVKEANLTIEERQAITFSLKPDRIFSFEVLPIAFLTLCLGIGYSSIMSFVNVYAIELNLIETASYFFIVYAIFLFGSRPIAGKILDARGDNIVVLPSIIFFALSLFFMSIADNSFLLLVAAALAAMGFGTYTSSAQAIAAKLASKKKMGLAISTFFIGLDSGIGIGPFLLGLIIPYTGYQNMYLALSIFVLCLTGLYYVIHGRKPIAKK
ncbi:MAG: MFS transporter [Solibacillus sp.]